GTTGDQQKGTIGSVYTNGNNTAFAVGSGYIEIPVIKMDYVQDTLFNVELYRKLYTTEVAGMTQYEFKVTDTATGFDESIIKDVNYFILFELGRLAEPGIYYDIRVRAGRYDEWGVFGNTLKLSVKADSIIIACEYDTIINAITGYSPTGEVVITVNLPAGFVVADTAIISGGDNGTVEINHNDPENPIYTITGLSGGSFNFGYVKQPACGSLSASNVTNLRDTITVEEVGNIIDLIVTDEYNLLSPVIDFDTAKSVKRINNLAIYNKPFERTFYFTNSGRDVSELDFFFIDTTALDPAGTSIRFDSIATDNTAGFEKIKDSVSDYHVDIRLRMTDFQQHDSIVIREWVTMIGCEEDNSRTLFSAGYGCTDDSILCREVKIKYHAQSGIDPNSYPAIGYGQSDYNYDTCLSNPTHRELVVINTGGPADSVSFTWNTNPLAHVAASSGPPVGYDITFIDTNNIYLYKYDQDGDSIPVSFEIADPDAHDFVYTIHTSEPLLSGDSIIICYDIFITCPSPEYDELFFTFQEDVVMFRNDEAPVVTLNYSCKHVEAKYTYYYEFDLLQEIIPDVVNMYGDTLIPVENREEWFHIESYALRLGHYTTTPIFFYDIAKSELLVELDMTPGLGLSEDNINFYFRSSNDSLLFPDTIEVRCGDNEHPGTGDTVIAHFKMKDSFITYQGAGNNIVSKGTQEYIDFFSNFDVWFKLVPYCEHICCRLMPGFEQKVYFVPNVNCGEDCKLPLFKVEYDVNVICPGCYLPGWNVDNFVIERTNIGYADNNNNNFPDAFPIDSLPVIDSLIHTDRIIIGDEILCSIQAHTSDGDILKELSFDTLTSGELLASGLLIDTAYIDSIDQIYNSVLNFNNIGFGYKYMQLAIRGDLTGKLNFSGADGIYRRNETDSTFYFPASVCNASSEGYYINIDSALFADHGFTGFDSVRYGDTIFIYPRFVITENLNDGIDYFHPMDVNAIISISGTPFGDINQKTDALLVDQDTIYYLDNDSMRSTYTYWCTAFDARPIGVGVYFPEGEVVLNTNSGYSPCYDIIRPNFFTNVGATVYNTSNSLNAFEFELRNLWMLDSITIKYPDIYKVDSMSLYVCQRYNDSLNAIPVSGTVVIDSTGLCSYTDTSFTIYPVGMFSPDTTYMEDPHRITGYDEIKSYRMSCILKIKDFNSYYDQFIPGTQGKVVAYWSGVPGDSTPSVKEYSFNNSIFRNPYASMLTETAFGFIPDINNTLGCNLIVKTDTTGWPWNFNEHDYN
ncbi:MAG: hypothetical protein KJ607_00910, partial [Bacteroidetes bacterium]|nr:hypothetical protein [Bacteroidota bacterium]